jgi:hypothetical protein
MCGHRSVRGRFLKSARLAITASLTLAVVLAASARSAEPERSPRRCIPARGLVAYLEYDGLDAHAAAWKATAAHDLLMKTPAGPMVLELVKQLTGLWLEEGTGGVVGVPDAMTIAEVMVRRGFACAISQDETVSHCMLVLKDIGRPENLKRLNHVRDVFNATPSVLFAEVERVSVRGRMILRLDGDQVSVWCEGDDLVLVCSLELFDFAGLAPNAQARNAQLPNAHEKHIGNILNCTEGKQVDAGKHPAYLSARAEGMDLKGFEPSGLWFIDTSGDLGSFMLLGGLDLAAELASAQFHFLPEPSKEEKIGGAAANEADDADGAAPPGMNDLASIRRDLGLDGLKRIVGRWGFQGGTLLSDIRLEAPAPRKALAACFDQPAFRSDRLPPMPAGTGMFVVGSVDLDGEYRALEQMLKAADADAVREFAGFDKELREITGLRLREDLLQPIGPTWCVYELPAGVRGGQRGERAAPWDHVLVARIKDADRAAKAIDKLAFSLDPADRFWDIFCDDAEMRKRRLARVPRFEPLPAPDRGYRLILPPQASRRAGRELQPTLLVGPSAVVIAGDLETARRARSIGSGGADRWQPSGELARALDGLPRELTFLAVADNIESPLPRCLGDLPSVVQRLVNVINEPNMEDASIWSVLDVFGLPRPGGPRIRVGRSRMPDPDRTRRVLLPSVVATAVDDRGLRIIGREALPFLGIANELKLQYRLTAEWSGFLPRFQESLTLTLPRFDWPR